jgi:hypothetical protein
MKAFAVWELGSEMNDFVVMNDILVVQSETIEEAAKQWVSKRVERAAHLGFYPSNFNIIVLAEDGTRSFLECDITTELYENEIKTTEVERLTRFTFSNHARSSRAGY